MSRVFLEMERLRNPFSGLGQFCRQLGEGLLRVKQGEGSGMVYTVFLPEDAGEPFGAEVEYEYVRPLHRWRLPRGTWDIWHCTHQDSLYWPKRRHRIRLVLTIHDLNFLERPNYPGWKKTWKLFRLQRRIDRATAVVYISNFTAGRVREHLRLPEALLQRVIYNGNNYDPALKPSGRPDWITWSSPFVLSLGIHPKKNYEALLPLLKLHPDLCWVIAGPDSRGYMNTLRMAAWKQGMQHQLLFTGVVSGAEKNWLLEHCRALWFPSLAEGFGLPAVEAMRAGKAVFLARRTSLPEIGGPDAFYWDSFEAAELDRVFQEGLRRFDEDPGIGQRLQEHASRFSWDRAAAEYSELYQELIKP
jgi:glycosyltransferase involved in cell wall biosynthesis